MIINKIKCRVIEYLVNKDIVTDLDDNGDGMLDNEELVVLFNSLNIVCADDDIKVHSTRSKGHWHNFSRF